MLFNSEKSGLSPPFANFFFVVYNIQGDIIIAWRTGVEDFRKLCYLVVKGAASILAGAYPKLYYFIIL